MRVVVGTHFVSPYQAELFNAVAALGGLDLEVVYLHQMARPSLDDPVAFPPGPVSRRATWPIRGGAGERPGRRPRGFQLLLRTIATGAPQCTGDERKSLVFLGRAPWIP